MQVGPATQPGRSKKGPSAIQEGPSTPGNSEPAPPLAPLRILCRSQRGSVCFLFVLEAPWWACDGISAVEGLFLKSPLFACCFRFKNYNVSFI